MDDADPFSINSFRSSNLESEVALTVLVPPHCHRQPPIYMYMPTPANLRRGIVLHSHFETALHIYKYSIISVQFAVTLTPFQCLRELRRKGWLPQMTSLSIRYILSMLLYCCPSPCLTGYARRVKQRNFASEVLLRLPDLELCKLLLASPLAGLRAGLGVHDIIPPAEAGRVVSNELLVVNVMEVGTGPYGEEVS
jgi:hypothetical protein